MVRGLQERLGVELTALVEDPERATIQNLVKEALAGQGSHAVATAAGAIPIVESFTSPWISRSPVSIKLLLFCLPYAGGVSENVFARCGRYCCFVSIDCM